MYKRVVKHVMVRSVSRKKVVEAMCRGSVDEQVERLAELVRHGLLPADVLRQALAEKVPEQMADAARRLKREGVELTPDALLADVRKHGSFLRLCEGLGLNEEWFVERAQEAIRRTEDRA